MSRSTGAIRLLGTTAFITSVLLATAPTAAADGDWHFDGDWLPSRWTVFTVGLQLGWDLSNGETVFGVDASYTLHDALAHGPTFSALFWRGGSRWQLGYEVVSETTLGFETGPTVAFNGDRDTLGWHATFFGGVFIVPYYQVTMLVGPDAEEAGAYLCKLPVLVEYRRDPNEW
jgi:hypothetical protein